MCIRDSLTRRRSRTASATGIGSVSATRRHGVASSWGTPATITSDSASAPGGSTYSSPPYAPLSRTTAAIAVSISRPSDPTAAGQTVLAGRHPTSHTAYHAYADTTPRVP